MKTSGQAVLSERQLIDLFNSGDVEKCITACKVAVDTDAENAVANNLLGSCFAKQKNFLKAILHLNYAVKLQAKNPTFLFNLALAQFQSGDLDGAIDNYQKALKVNNGLYRVHFNLARVYTVKGDFAKAIKSYEKAIKLNKTYLEAYFALGDLFISLGDMDKATKLYKAAVANNKKSAKSCSKLGYCYTKTHRLDEALASYKKQVALEPNNPTGIYNVGVSLSKLGRSEDAIKHYKQAIKLNPGYEDALYHLGVAYMALKDTKNAIKSYKKCLSINKNNPGVLFSYANALRAIEHWGAAIKNYRLAIAIDENYDAAYVNLAVALNAINRGEEAYSYAKKALEINPRRKEAFLNIGNYFLNKCELDKALEYYYKATDIDAHYVGALWNESIIHLLKGDFLKGWALYKCRMEKEEFETVKARISGKTWAGESLKGKCVLLHHEQGMGDTFQFIRYAKQVADLGAKVLIDCPPGIAKLMESAAGVSKAYSKVEDFPAYDYNCPLLDLPAIFKSNVETIPNDIPYLSVKGDLSNWLELDKNRINIGVVWAGNPMHAKDTIRSCDFKLIEGLFGVNKKAMFYSLQVGERAEDLQFTAELGRNIEDLSELLTNFSVTASVIDRLDLVITVDTSVAHLAGALGMPVWTLLQFSPDWRWMLDRNDSPWYPTMRLFRQPKNGDWASVFKEVKKELRSIQKN
ncbi:MAG: tetratricopeptide repeat protein [Cycloclasticus sp.]